ncbi:MAG: hypothetical protein EKK41_13560 [Hyphomicrobiales bacterium]|nr:MAG: hypothetical protein EKK41_13560 [Hyphomicrobiales bacterium]
MRVFFHILTDAEPILDGEGSELASLSEAEAEAKQTARDLMADALRRGDYAPVHWQVQACSGDGSQLFSVSFWDCAIRQGAERPAVRFG